MELTQQERLTLIKAANAQLTIAKELTKIREILEESNKPVLQIVEPDAPPPIADAGVAGDYVPPAKKIPWWKFW